MCLRLLDLGSLLTARLGGRMLQPMLWFQRRRDYLLLQTLGLTSSGWVWGQVCSFSNQMGSSVIPDPGPPSIWNCLLVFSDSFLYHITIYHHSFNFCFLRHYQRPWVAKDFLMKMIFDIENPNHIWECGLVTPWITGIPYSSRSLFTYITDLQNSLKQGRTESVAITAIHQVYFVYKVSSLSFLII